MTSSVDQSMFVLDFKTIDLWFQTSSGNKDQVIQNKFLFDDSSYPHAYLYAFLVTLN